MHDLLFANMNALEITDFLRHSRNLNLNTQEFQQCLEKGKYESEIRKDMVEGQRSGVKGTHTFLVGVIDQDSSKMKALKRIRGAQPFPAFKEVLDSLLPPQK
jgi:predicted DsbA family dithiol-disulfide isomerase